MKLGALAGGLHRRSAPLPADRGRTLPLLLPVAVTPGRGFPAVAAPARRPGGQRGARGGRRGAVPSRGRRGSPGAGGPTPLPGRERTEAFLGGRRRRSGRSAMDRLGLLGLLCAALLGVSGAGMGGGMDRQRDRGRGGGDSSIPVSVSRRAFREGGTVRPLRPVPSAQPPPPGSPGAVRGRRERDPAALPRPVRRSGLLGPSQSCLNSLGSIPSGFSTHALSLSSDGAGPAAQPRPALARGIPTARDGQQRARDPRPGPAAGRGAGTGCRRLFHFSASCGRV